MTIHMNVAAVLADLNHQALTHDLEAQRIRSAIAILTDLYPQPLPAPAAEQTEPDTQPAPASAAEPEAVESSAPILASEPAATATVPQTIRERIAALYAEHPEYTRRQAWEALGITEGSLSGHSYALGIKWTPAPLPIPVKKAAPYPPAPPEDAIAPDETNADAMQMRHATPAKGQRFRLRVGRGEGKYLHMSGIGLTDDRTYAWIGTEAQMVKLRQKFADARDLVEEAVQKEVRV